MLNAKKSTLLQGIFGSRGLNKLQLNWKLGASLQLFFYNSNKQDSLTKVKQFAVQRVFMAILSSLSLRESTSTAQNRTKKLVKP